MACDGTARGRGSAAASHVQLAAVDAPCAARRGAARPCTALPRATTHCRQARHSSSAQRLCHGAAAGAPTLALMCTRRTLPLRPEAESPLDLCPGAACWPSGARGAGPVCLRARAHRRQAGGADVGRAADGPTGSRPAGRLTDRPTARARKRSAQRRARRLTPHPPAHHRPCPLPPHTPTHLALLPAARIHPSIRHGRGRVCAPRL